MTDLLWHQLREPRRDQGSRLERVEELLFLGDQRLPAYLTQQIREAPAPWRWVVVDMAQQALVVDEGQRRAMSVALLSVARELSAAADGAADRTLWSAVRRLGSLLPGDEVGVLLEFLREGLRATTHQVTLQALQAAYAVEPAEAPRTEALRDRVTAMARATLEPARLTSPAAMALAANAFAAALLLGGPEVPELTQQLLATEQRPLLKQALRSLEAAAEHRASLDPSPGPLPGLEPTLTALRGALRA
jgi:hypothetical protein